MGKFAGRLKELRTSKHLTQEQFAKKMGISRSTVGMYEKGNREPDYETLEAFADFFNVDIDYLLGRSDKTTTLTDSGYYTDPETAKIAQALHDPPELSVMFDAYSNLDPKDAQLVLDMIKRMSND